MQRPTITLHVPGHGTHTVTAAALDLTIIRYLPTSPAQLRQVVAERAGHPVDVHEVAALLVMLADFDHNVDHDPLSVVAARANGNNR